VTPSYNQAPFLETAIRSVLMQDYPNFEYLILDGGSTDGSLEIIRRYQPWLAYFTSGPDGGQTAAINQGFARATGDILAWLNADDAYLPGAVTRAVAALAAAPEVVLAHGRCVFIDEDGAESKIPDVPVKPQPSLAELINDQSVVWQPATFFRQQALKSVGPLNETLYYSMDFDLMLRLRQKGAFAFQDEAPVALFREQALAKTFALPLAMIAERYQVSRAFGGDGVSAALHTLQFRWEALRRTESALWPQALRRDLTSAEFRGLPRPMRRAARPLAAELLMASGFEAVGRSEIRDAAACFRAALQYNPRWLTNRGMLSILAQAGLGWRWSRKPVSPPPG
jgi:glycosyltransferase involved in cell wall biosynthesis